MDRCVESAVNQTYRNIEIILVDDGSPDKCPEMCDAWKAKDERIIVIHKPNGGLSDARNYGIREAKGDYILFLDSDDYIDLYAVEIFNNRITGEDLIVSEATIYENGEIIHRVHTNLQEDRIYTGRELATIAISKGEWFAAACYNVYRREFLIENNLFFKIGILHEDNEFQPRLFLAAQKVRYVHYEFYKYVIRDGSITSSPSQKSMNDLFSTFSEWRKLNDTIEENDVRKAYAGALCKTFIYTCRTYKVTDNVYPDGITKRYLMQNALNIKELVKTSCFIILRKLYVQILK